MGNKAFNSFGRLKVINTSHIFWEEVAVISGQVLDSVMIQQEDHGPFKESTLNPDVSQEIEKKKEKEKQEQKTNNQNSATDVNQPTQSDDVGKFGRMPGQIKEMLSHVNKTVVVAVASGCGVLIILIIVLIVVKKKRGKPKAYRRWDEKVDYGRKYYSSYSHVDNGDAAVDDFEVEVTDGNLPTSKLLTSDK